MFCFSSAAVLRCYRLEAGSSRRRHSSALHVTGTSRDLFVGSVLVLHRCVSDQFLVEKERIYGIFEIMATGKW